MIRIMERDIELFNALLKYHLMTLTHIKDAVFQGVNDSTVVRRRLNKLKDNGLIGAYSAVNETGRPMNVWHLRKNGYYYLDTEIRRLKKPSPLFLLHYLDLVTIQIAFEREFAHNGIFRLRTFVNERMTKEIRYTDGSVKRVNAIYDRCTIRGEKLNVQPDAVMILEHAEKKFRVLYFIENDRATERGASSIHRKIVAYDSYANFPERFTKKYNVTINQFRVLFLTPDQKRIKNLLKKHAWEKGSRLFFFAVLEDIRKSGSLTKPIWTLSSGNSIALVKEKSESEKRVPMKEES